MDHRLVFSRFLDLFGMIFKINILFLVSHRCYTTNTRFNSNGDANTNYLDLHYEACGLEELIERLG